MFERGEVWWASLPEPDGSEPGGRRPVVVVQASGFNKSSLKTVTVVNVTQILTIDRRLLTDRVGNMSTRVMGQVDEGIRRALAL